MDNNRSVIQFVTTTLSILAGFCVFTICLLSYFQIQIPPELNTLAGTLCGGVGGMLVKTSPTAATSPDSNSHPTPTPPETPPPNTP